MKKNPNTLWTRDFTILTVGSIVSMIGNDLSGFAMGLLVLDFTGSTLYYALYMALYLVPSIVMPVLSGPLLDRFSRRRAIYVLDFVSAGLYTALALTLHFGLFSFPLLAAFTFFLGCIDSVYGVAYESFYPLLITKGNYGKAYSISSTLQTMTMLVTPFSALIYNTLGVELLFAINAATYLLAAIAETQIRAKEAYVEEQAQTAQKASGALQRFGSDLKEGFGYLWSEKGLLAVAVYFGFSALAGGASGVISLPWFRANFENGEYIHLLVWSMSAIGRTIGGFFHYKVTIPPQYRFGIALAVYITISVLEATYLFFPIWVMMIFCFCTGILGVTSYNIRISATQRYVPDGKKGRFNGAFAMLSTGGALVGQVLAGALTTFMDERTVLAIFMGVCVVAAIVFVGGGRRDVAKIYNTID